MVFPSVPVYLDPPNWNQQQQAHQQLGSSRAAGSSGGGSEDPLIPPGLAVPHSSDGTVSGSAGRSVSMAERARLAKIPQPEPALKCPRCDSPNTKFCYFNNYSLSQPRHFCKTCRRYWTRGGALRSVPVGGGCRRNKRSKSSVGSSSKSTSGATSDRQAGASSSSSVAVTSAAAGAMTSSSMPLQPHIPFLASLHPLPDYVTPNLGLSFARIPQTDAGDYQVTGAGGGLESLRVHQQMQHLPNFLGALEPPQTLPPASVAGLYSLVGEGSTMDGSSLMGHAPTMKAPHSGFITQLVKMEDSHNQGLNFPRSYLSAQQNLDNFWNTAGSSGGESSGGNGAGASGWAPDLSGFSTSATGNPL